MSLPVTAPVDKAPVPFGRTPLTAILGYAELLRGASPATDIEGVRRLVDVIYRNGLGLKALIDSSLDLSKIEAGHLELESAMVSIPELLTDLRSLLANRAAAKGIELRFDRSEGTPDVVFTDPTRLRQILLNVLDNAVKFTSVGRVLLTTEAATVAGQRSAVITFSVTDTGIGLTLAQRDKLFQPFSQADASMTRRFGGTGLGLVLARRLARLFHGDVVLTESAPGVGSTFAVTVTVALAPGTAAVDGAARGAVGEAPRLRAVAEIRVLLAEDAEDPRLFFVEALTYAGARVDVAMNGREAVDKAMAQPYDVVLMDIQMPDVDGYRALSELRQRGYGRPIVMLSAHAVESARRLPARGR